MKKIILLTLALLLIPCSAYCWEHQVRSVDESGRYVTTTDGNRYRVKPWDNAKIWNPGETVKDDGYGNVTNPRTDYNDRDKRGW
jgi:uncharacterized protein YxeA